MSVAVAPAPAGAVTPPPKGALAAPRLKRWTVAEFDTLLKLDLVQPRRHQLIRGEIVDMGEQGSQHYSAVRIVAAVLGAAFGPGFDARPAGPIELADSKPEPDVAIVPGSVRDYLTAHPKTALLAVEVSYSTLHYDLTTKAELYATAGIPEYWVLDLEARVLHVFRDPQPNAALGVTTYRNKTEHAATETVTPLGASAVKVSDLLP